MPGWLDNGFHSHHKRELVPVAVDGLLARAISRACDLMSDGFVEASWASKQLTPKERKRVLDQAVRHRLLEPLAAGETRIARGTPRTGLRREEIQITVGPFDVDGYLIHDFLDCNRARTEIEGRRKSDARRKREERGGRAQPTLPWEETPSAVSPTHTVSADCPPDVRCDSRDRDRGVQPVEAEEPSAVHARARSSSPEVQQVLDLLHQVDRLHVDAVGVENAVRAFPDADPIRAAREVVTFGSDPAYRLTNAARMLWKALEGQLTPAPGTSRRRGPASARDFQMLKGGA